MYFDDGRGNNKQQQKMIETTRKPTRTSARTWTLTQLFDHTSQSTAITLHESTCTDPKRDIDETKLTQSNTSIHTHTTTKMFTLFTHSANWADCPVHTHDTHTIVKTFHCCYLEPTTKPGHAMGLPSFSSGTLYGSPDLENAAWDGEHHDSLLSNYKRWNGKRNSSRINHLPTKSIYYKFTVERTGTFTPTSEHNYKPRI